ncbi:MAG: RNA polymerase sigma factor [Acidobacteria bacterium]|nr:RNA polymerase sigma factor [Acidobacteriota bacterium]
MTDADLVARARDGDVDAFGVLVDRHRRAVHRAALAALGCPGEADDVTQEAFIQAWQALPRFRGESSVRTWLLAIAWRRAIDRRRSLKRLATRFLGLDGRRNDLWPATDEGGPYASIDESGGSPERQVLVTELAAATRRLVRTLPAPLRDALLLAASGQHTMEEIAAMTDTPTGTVKWRVAEARRRLRERLARLGFP